MENEPAEYDELAAAESKLFAEGVRLDSEMEQWRAEWAEFQQLSESEQSERSEQLQDIVTRGHAIGDRVKDWERRKAEHNARAGGSANG